MDLVGIFKDKAIKPKEKTEAIAVALLGGALSVDTLIGFAGESKDAQKATCIEAIELATKQQPAIANDKVFKFVTAALADKAPRVKWESARVIGNTASLFSSQASKAIPNLLANAEHEGTVVRWSAAYALGEIIKLKTALNKDLLPAAEAICEREEKNSIKKIYLGAIKKAQK
ncbi:MAG: HEAT repeat domain-containing protein [Bacteroidetes bacterium]|nr:HEAT repeat domain-containing protein [Bacteroidota bacterium]